MVWPPLDKDTAGSPPFFQQSGRSRQSCTFHPSLTAVRTGHLSCSRGIAHSPSSAGARKNSQKSLPVPVFSMGPGGRYRTRLTSLLSSSPSSSHHHPSSLCQVFLSKPSFHSGLLSKPTPRPTSTYIFSLPGHFLLEGEGLQKQAPYSKVLSLSCLSP